jgi:hypothetical protein
MEDLSKERQLCGGGRKGRRAKKIIKMRNGVVEEEKL